MGVLSGCLELHSTLLTIQKPSLQAVQRWSPAVPYTWNTCPLQWWVPFFLAPLPIPLLPCLHSPCAHCASSFFSPNLLLTKIRFAYHLPVTINLFDYTITESVQQLLLELKLLRNEPKTPLPNSPCVEVYNLHLNMPYI